MIHGTKKLLIIPGTILVILFVSSTLLTVQYCLCQSNSKSLSAGDKEDEEIQHTLMVVSQTLKESIIVVKILSTIQIPMSRKDQQYLQKVTWFKKYVTICIGLLMALYNAIFLVTDKGVVAVDAPPSIGKNYLESHSRSDRKASKNYVILPVMSCRSYWCLTGIFPKR